MMQRQDIAAFIARTECRIKWFHIRHWICDKTIGDAVADIIIGRSRSQPMRLRHLISEINIAGVQALPVVILCRP